jgi:hypothetical protein
MRWQRLNPVGLGESYRGCGDEGILATAVVAGGGLVHLGVSMAT